VVSDVDQASGRVREKPDVRTVRYYTTIGLLDRAAEMRGRTAYYSERHLRQLVAIKRLQADGLSLQQVQARLLGATNKTLRELAPLPALPEREAKPQVSRGNFWRQQPVKPAPAGESIKSLRTLTLAADVLLTAALPAELTANDQQALLEAAAPLLRWLEQQRGTSGDAAPQPEEEQS
jgi:DNA-binding transcriptional MerR regulator